MTSFAKQGKIFTEYEYHFYEVRNKHIMSYPEEERYGCLEVLKPLRYKTQNVKMEIGKTIEITMSKNGVKDKKEIVLCYDIVGSEEDTQAIAENIWRVYVLPKQQHQS